MSKRTNAEMCREQYAKHRDKRLAAKREDYAADPEKMRERNRKQYAANREARIQYAREYRAKRREELAAKARQRYYAGGDALKERRREISKTPERRAKQNELQRRWAERNPDKALRFYAKNLLAEQIGARAAEIPDDVADAKVEQLKITRWVREQLNKDSGA